jgi:colanic acid/amylovoran biosynthesis protein
VDKYCLSGDLALMLRGNIQRKYSRVSLPANFSWGLTIVDWKFPNTPNPDRLRKDYLESLIETCEYIYHLTGSPGIILNQVAADSAFARSILRYTSSVVFDESVYSYSDMISRISGFDFFIGTRFHSCVFAICNSVPFVSISYLPKSTGILDQLNLLDLSVDINSCKSTLLSLVKLQLSDLDNLTQRISGSSHAYTSLFISPFVQSLKGYI